MTSIFRRLTDLCGCTERQLPDTRIVYINHIKPPHHEVDEEEFQYPDNTVMSSKYSAWNFFPKNLFEQFRRIANFYFLLVAVLQLTIDSPVAAWTSIMPLIFVISVTMIKQGYEDILRHRADKEVNNKETAVLRHGRLEEVVSSDIHVGDIVYCVRDVELPCDMVLLSSQNEDGECYVTTANLDGETNLKIFRSLPDTCVMQDQESLMSLNAMVECHQPITDLYRFIGRMKLFKPNSTEPITRSLSAENLLLRGSKVKNTPFIFGVAVYTGEQTKMALNSRKKGIKFSCIERSMNKYLVAMLVYLLLQTILSTILKYVYNNKDLTEKSWYFFPSAAASGDYSGKVGKMFEDFLSFLVLFNYIIPISLYVTLEMQKFTGSMFIGLDMELYDAKTDQRARANTSDLNEELGQVEYMFTDKTGTLTENDMQFRHCSIKGVKYTEVDDHLKPYGEGKASKEDVLNFLLMLALCHTVHVNSEKAVNGDVPDGPLRKRSISREMLEYQASSPDEKALVEAANRFGVSFISGSQEYLELLVDGDLMRYTVLDTLEFDPTRKCMSIILKSPDGEIKMLCKGAESSIVNKSISGPKDETLKHVTDYAVEGLRTLCFGIRKLTSVQFEEFHAQLADARQALENREEKVSECYEFIENNLELIGATAVEDKLQDGVQETIEALREAGIKVWVLTGDKLETAVNISHSCGHFKQDMRELTFVQLTTEQEVANTLAQHKEQMQLDPYRNYSLVVDGPTLAILLRSQHDAFRDMCLQCGAVLCCRMSPLQKALVVKLVKYSPGQPSTMAIGDGANDVSMIQEAHLGLGIMGKEGRQAVRSSDYAFARFRFLLRILLVHGHWYYHRIAITVQYFFYKNFAFITAQFYYAFYTYFSEQTVFESIYLTLFNITCTALPILIFGIFEQNYKPKDLLAFPSTYKKINRNSYFTAWECTYWVSLGLWHSLVFFLGFRFLVGDDIPLQPNMQMYGVWMFGTFVYTITVLVANFKLCIETSYWNWMMFAAFAISIAGYPVLISLYSGVLWPEKGLQSLFDSTALYNVFFTSFKSWSVWFNFALLTVIAFLPDYIYKAAKLYYQPNLKPKRKQPVTNGGYDNKGMVFNEETDGGPPVTVNGNWTDGVMMTSVKNIPI